MRILVSCANGSGTSLMMMRSVEKAMKELNVPITKIHHCAISEGKVQLANTSFYASQFLNMFTQAEKKGVTVIGIKNVMSVKEISEKFAETKWYQKQVKEGTKMSRPNLQIALDHNDLEHALGDVMKVGDVVDIIEVGTILCLQEGQKRFAVFAVCSQIKTSR